MDFLCGMYSSVGEPEFILSRDLCDLSLLPLLFNSLGLSYLVLMWIGFAPKLSFKWLPDEVMPRVKGSSMMYLGDSIIGRNSSMFSFIKRGCQVGFYAEPTPKVYLGPVNSALGADCLLLLLLKAAISFTCVLSIIGIMGSEGCLFIGLSQVMKFFKV